MYIYGFLTSSCGVKNMREEAEEGKRRTMMMPGLCEATIYVTCLFKKQSTREGRKGRQTPMTIKRQHEGKAVAIMTNHHAMPVLKQAILSVNIVETMPGNQYY